MSVNSGQISSLAKAVTSQTPLASSAVTYTTNSSFDSSSQRRLGGSGSFGAGLTSRSASGFTRASQTRRPQHKRHRRPRLLDDVVVDDDSQYSDSV